MQKEYNLEQLVSKISEFANVNKKEKLIDISDEILIKLTGEQLRIIKLIQKHRYMLQYFIE